MKETHGTQLSSYRDNQSATFMCLTEDAERVQTGAWFGSILVMGGSCIFSFQICQKNCFVIPGSMGTMNISNAKSGYANDLLIYIGGYPMLNFLDPWSHIYDKAHMLSHGSLDSSITEMGKELIIIMCDSASNTFCTKEVHAGKGIYICWVWAISISDCIHVIEGST